MNVQNMRMCIWSERSRSIKINFFNRQYMNSYNYDYNVFTQNFIFKDSTWKYLVLINIANPPII